MNETSVPTKPAGKKRTVTRVLVAAKLVFSVGLLVVLFRWIDADAMWSKFAGIHVGWVLFSILLLQTQCIISTAKWQIILRADGHRVPFLFLWKTYFISGFLGLFLPTSFGGDIYRVWALNQRGIHATKSTASVLFDRSSGLFALATVGVIGTAILIGGPYTWLFLSVYLAGVAVFAVVTSDYAIARLPAARSKWLAFPFRVLQSFNTYRHSRGVFAAITLLSGMFQLNVVVIIYCYARALNVPATDVSFWEMLATVPVVYLTEMLPVSINGIGVRDGAFVFFFVKVGGTAEQGLAVSLLVIALRYINGTIGGLLLLADTIRGRKLRDSAVRESSPTGIPAPLPDAGSGTAEKCMDPAAP